MALFNSIPPASKSLRVLARLLGYPDHGLRGHLSELQAALHLEKALPAPRLPREWGPLEITGQDPVRREERAADAVSTLRLQARAFVTGSLATPLLALNLVDQAGASRAVEARLLASAVRTPFAPGVDTADRGQGLVQAPTAAVSC